MGDVIKLKGGTAAEWTAANPVLRARELGVETDTLNSKLGDGVTRWNVLPYASKAATATKDIANVDNTSDADKPLSIATAAALATKADAEATASAIAAKADASATTTALAGKLPIAALGAADGVASLDTDGLHKVSEYRPANHDGPGSMSVADYVAQKFIGTAGTGGLAANKLCYWDAASSTLLLAQANTIATARKIMGATTVVVSAAASATLSRRGQARITAAADCVPVVGANAYLSSVTGGTVTSVLSGTMYPRLVGVFLEGTADGNGTVLVDLDLSDARDDSAELVLYDSVVSGAAFALLTVPLTRAFWRELQFTAQSIGDTTAGGQVSFASDRTFTTILDGAGPGLSFYPNTAVGLALKTSLSVNNVEFTDKWVGGTQWDRNAFGWAAQLAQLSYAAGVRRYLRGVVDNPGNFVADGGAALIFQVGSHLKLTGKVRL